MRMDRRQKPLLTPMELKRYHRQIILPGWGQEAQEKLARATVFIAGLGGLGSPLAMYLAAAGVGTLRLCDAGKVELSDLNRQLLHSERGLNRPKTRSARQTLRRVNPHVRVVPLRATIDENSAESLVGGASLIVDCLDNFPARLALNSLAVARGLPLIHAGVSGFCGQITFLHPPETACLACMVREIPSQGINPILGPTAGLLGCLEALEALKFLTGTGPLLRGRLLFCDLASSRFEEVAIERDPRCPVCGDSSS
jgi:molybdopterin-synthase adenylyltransferase